MSLAGAVRIWTVMTWEIDKMVVADCFQISE